MMSYFAIGLCLLLSFLLSGLESAVMAVSRVRVRHAAANGDPRARGLLALIEDRDALLGCITVANHIANLTVFLLVALPLVRHASVLESSIVFLLSLPIFLIGLEVVPKKLFRRFPFRSLRSVWLLLHAVGVARPVFRAFSPSKDTPVREIEGISTSTESQRRDDLKQLARSLGIEHQLSLPATRLIDHILDFHRLTAADVMQPLTQSVALAAELPLHTALILAREQNTPVLPVLGDNGTFIGVLDTSELPTQLPPDRLVRQHMRTLDSIHASESAIRALQRLRKQGRRLAIVTDARGLPAGLITEEHLLAPLMK
jgi:CBS domain containing-hemolysin-like protein